MKAKHGLVIGKFYPPHAGHHALVRAASAGSERVTVLVLAAHVESIPLELRVAWMREVHAPDTNVTIVGAWDDHPIDLESDAIWAAHVDVMKEAVRSITHDPVDVVFSSEAYGEELARRFGALHAPVDPERAAQPISGTAVRADRARHWHMLEPCVRAHLCLRVVLVGAESTGKTTLAAALAERLAQEGGAFAQTEWVRELGRDATVDKLGGGEPSLLAMAELAWSTADFVAIARAQAALEEEAARRGGPVLFCDTDAFATGVWHERYRGHRDESVEAPGIAAPHHIYLLTHHDDVPFVQDGIRDGEHLRAWMTGVFEARLRESGRSWVWLRGAREERLDRALRTTLDRYAELRLAPPLG